MAARAAVARLAGGRGYLRADTNKTYPSVTTILKVIDKPGLVDWATSFSLSSTRSELVKALTAADGKLSVSQIESAISVGKAAPTLMRDDAATFGTAVHTAIDAVIKGQTPPPAATSKLGRMVDTFIEWRKASNLTFDPRGDIVVHSDKYEYAGALDALATDAAGNRVLLDFKTTSAMRDEYALQVAAYAAAYEEMNGPALGAVKTAFIVRFDKRNGDVEVKQVTDLKLAFQGFKAALFLHRLLAAPERPPLFE